MNVYEFNTIHSYVLINYFIHYLFIHYMQNSSTDSTLS